MNERDLLIWAAGFFDGEGCASIGRTRRERTGLKSNRRLKNSEDFWYGYTANVAVSQKQEAPLKRLHEMFDGHLFSYRSRGTTYWRWQQWSGGAADCLRKLLPYLLVKRDIADTVIRFQEQLTQWNAEFGRNGYPDWVVAGREAYWQQARTLNQRNRADDRAPKYEGPKILQGEKEPLVVTVQ